MLHIDAPRGGLGDAWAPDISAFAAYWKSMRDGELTPTSERLLDNPAPQFASTTYIADITPEGAIVRFQGAELIHFWMRDFTGIELHTRRTEDLKRNSLANMHEVITRPCGYLASLSFSTASGRKLNSELIQLPLRVKPGRPPRLVCFSHIDMDTGWQETFTRYLEIHRREWVDIGEGVPGDPPKDLLQLD